MPSTTIRYSTLPENSQPTDLEDTPPPHYGWEHDLHTAPGREPESAPGWMPGHELHRELGRELSHELGRELNREFDRELTRTWAGLHFERHQAEPEPETPAHGTPGSAMPDRNAPDPNTPGAYRHDPSDPAACDPSLPDSDPRSPRYEPPHLRHRPGDTFEIGGKPHDPLDPGPYGSPGWFQDRRTGRHRRGELPDPLPEDERPMPVPSPPPAPIPAPASPVDAPRPYPYRRTRRWSAPEDRLENGTGPDPAAAPENDPPYRFSPLREGAMQRFLELSQPFRDAHFQPQPPSLTERLLWVLRWFLWIATCGLRPAPSPLTAASESAHFPALEADATGVSRLPAPLSAHLSTARGAL